MKDKRRSGGQRSAAGVSAKRTGGPFVPGWKALRSAFVNDSVKTSCKYPCFIYMTWSSSGKYKAGYLQGGVGGSFFQRYRQRGWEGSHKVIWRFISSWAWLAVWIY